jgi:ATP-binding cassette subfamily B protein
MDIQDGTITIDGQDVSKSKQRDIRKAISYVPQDALLFHRSITENISYGNPLVSKNYVKKAAQQANADAFIKELPDGYDTIVGERGVKLSGGQRQRIAIARAMLKNAPILVLDEATSALDSESEVLIQDALWKLMRNKTAIVVAHRLSTIQKMDRILVLDNGKIVEQGPHKQLLKNKSGLYARLWAHQSGGFLQE